MSNDKSPDKIIFDTPEKAIDISSINWYDPEKHGRLSSRILIFAGSELVSVDVKTFDKIIKSGV